MLGGHADREGAEPRLGGSGRVVGREPLMDAEEDLVAQILAISFRDAESTQGSPDIGELAVEEGTEEIERARARVTRGGLEGDMAADLTVPEAWSAPIDGAWRADPGSISEKRASTDAERRGDDGQLERDVVVEVDDVPEKHERCVGVGEDEESVADRELDTHKRPHGEIEGVR